jgi:hypothetical protein
MTRKTDPGSAQPIPTVLSRRTVFAGAGTLGALAAAAAVLPGAKKDQAVASADLAAPADQGQGYRLTEHVKRYYQTARV